MCHGVVTEDGAEETKAAKVEGWFRQMADYQNEGKLWVTTFGDAVKYIRERQNSSVNAVENADGIYVNVIMSEKTADNLPLTTDIFDQPLTVKVRVDSDVNRVTYSLSGNTET